MRHITLAISVEVSRGKCTFRCTETNLIYLASSGRGPFENEAALFFTSGREIAGSIAIEIQRCSFTSAVVGVVASVANSVVINVGLIGVRHLRTVV